MHGIYMASIASSCMILVYILATSIVVSMIFSGKLMLSNLIMSSLEFFKYVFYNFTLGRRK